MAKHGNCSSMFYPRLERWERKDWKDVVNPHDYLNIISQQYSGKPLDVGTRNRKKPRNKSHWFLINIFASIRTGGRLVLSSIPASFETSPQVWNESEQSMLIYQRPIWAIHLLATRRQAVQPDFVGQMLRPHMFKNPAQCQISSLAIIYNHFLFVRFLLSSSLMYFWIFSVFPITSTAAWPYAIHFWSLLMGSDQQEHLDALSM